MPLQENLSLSTLDLTDVLEIAANDRGFLNELLSLYVQQFSELVPEITTHLKAHDILALRRILHKIKPSLILLRQTALHQQAQKIHDMLHEQAVSPEELRDEFRPLTVGFTQLLKLLESAFEEHAKTA